MLFNSFEYLVFLPIVFFIYWVILKNSIKGQNLFLLIVSYIFYGWWSWKFLILISITGLNDYTLAIQIFKSERQKIKKLLLSISIIVNLGILFFFKYYNFFIDSLIQALNKLNVHPDIHTLKIVLPVGISFYTFQSLSYTIDVYRKKMPPARSFINFFAFISFFPQLVAGPIERAIHLIPQFEKKRSFKFEQAKDGLLQILWGLFKKAVIADNCSTIVDYCFKNYTHLSPIYLIFGIVYFAFQIYCDFSGYSDMAIGSAKLLGFSLMRNFAYPYFSRSIPEFWRKWHISLTTWFRDYLYIPLGGSKVNLAKKVRNTFVIFLVSGFWHGANWTFVIWGFLNALYFMPSLFLDTNRRYLDVIAEHKYFPTIKEFFQVMLTFMLVCIAWVFFRAASMHEAIGYLRKMFDLSNIAIPDIRLFIYIPFIILLLIFEWLKRDCQHPLELKKKSKIFQYAIYLFIALVTIEFGNFGGASFIYFQF